MIDFDDIKNRLRYLTEHRNFFFKDTTREEAEKHLKSKTEFLGMTEAEVQELEQELGKQLPEDFKHYLFHFGKNCGELFCCGQDIEPTKFALYQDWAASIIEEQNQKSFLTENALVFYFHQGYSFFYFDCDGHKCPIYHYYEGSDAPTKIVDSFSDLLNHEIQKLEDINAKIQDDDGSFLTIHNGIHLMSAPAKSSGIKPREIGDQFIEPPAAGSRHTGIVRWFARWFK